MLGLQNDFLKLADILIDNCFSDKKDDIKKKYKNFKLVLVSKEYSSRLGCYNMKTNTIQLSGINTYCKCDVIITFLHELSHHIETIDCGKSGHQYKFYEIHIKLLKSAIDFGIIKIEDITENKTSVAGNRNKLKKLINNYKCTNKNLPDLNLPFLNQMPEIPINKRKVKVKCLMEDKEILKTRFYKWNTVELIWEKIVDNIVEYNMEIDFLLKNGFQNIKIDKVSYFAKYINIYINGNTYEHKEELKGLKYKYKDGGWIKCISVIDVDIEIIKLRKMKGIKITYTF